MGIKASNELRVFVLNVGQADTSVVITPSGNITVIDAVAPAKLISLLGDLGLSKGDAIETLILTHPHNDHYAGAAKLLSDYDIHFVVLASFEPYTGTPGYHAIINVIEEHDIPCLFVPSHNALYPDGALVEAGQRVAVDVVGPSLAILNELAETGRFDPNYLSLVARVTFGKFSMVLAADAQMENWQHYDQEGMMRHPAQVLKAAHHGSRHGTQCERLERLGVSCVIVSSDPEGRHELPDLVGAAIFYELSRRDILAVMTKNAGTVCVTATNDGKFSVCGYYESAHSKVVLGSSKPLTPDVNPTNWADLVRLRLTQ
jgi:competence protein ComEC